MDDIGKSTSNISNVISHSDRYIDKNYAFRVTKKASR